MLRRKAPEERHLELFSDLYTYMYMSENSSTYQCANPSSICHKEKNRNIFKVVDKTNAVGKEVAVVRQISTAEGKLKTSSGQ